MRCSRSPFGEASAMRLPAPSMAMRLRRSMRLIDGKPKVNQSTCRFDVLRECARDLACTALCGLDTLFAHFVHEPAIECAACIENLVPQVHQEGPREAD